MKLVLSRKGFDAATGRFPSPILPLGQLCSLPIPDNYPQRQRQWVDDFAQLATVGRGQEFVLDTDHYPEAPA